MANLRKVARQKARKYGLDPNIFGRQINAESGYNANAVSPAGAIGVAQIMPTTAKGWGVNPRDPVAALDAAAKNMAGYVKQFGSYRNALVAYNAGPGRVGGSLPAETQRYVANILGGQSPKGLAKPAAPRSPAPVASATTGDAKTQIALSLLGMGGLTGGSYGSGDSLTNSLIAAAQQGQAQGGQPSYGGIAPKGNLQDIVKRANQVDKERLPYKWGGGHGPTPAKPGVPLDCSGAVSRVLGVNPRVSGQFAKWGAPGRGKGLTVYANDKHVLMEVDGHFFGTSATNPGGGAGWIPRSAISPAYLKNFTARHLPAR